MTVQTIDPFILAYAAGLALLAFSVWRPGILVYLAVIAAMFGVLVAGDKGPVSGWVQASAGIIMIWSLVRIMTGTLRG